MLTGRTSGVNALVFSPGDRSLATADADGGRSQRGGRSERCPKQDGYRYRRLCTSTVRRESAGTADGDSRA